MSHSEGALAGVRIVEFGQYVAAPLLGMLLADQGAEVVKVERPGGDPTRDEIAFAVWNRGKQSIALDLKDAADRATAEELIRGADVVIENLGEAKADALGVGYERAYELKSDIVYCSLPAFAKQNGRAATLGWEPLIQAMVGMQTNYAFSDATPPSEPERALHTPLPLPSTLAAATAASAIVAALIARDRLGVGQRVDVPLYNACFNAIGLFLLNVNDQPPAFGFRYPTALRVQCADGRYVQLQGIEKHLIERSGGFRGMANPTPGSVRHQGGRRMGGDHQRRRRDLHRRSVGRRVSLERSRQGSRPRGQRER
jgi:crotonobetainyl-CoA:carnitine CoA-transferase CaiB-like acyl-CoA transferase